MPDRPWPWPADSREDRAKRVARSYREVLENIARGRHDELGLPYDPAGELHRLDQHWIQHGAYWAVPSFDPYDAADWVNAEDAAHYTDVEPTTVRKWAEQKRKGRDGIIERVGRDGKPEYNVGDIREYEARRKQARARRRTP